MTGTEPTILKVGVAVIRRAAPKGFSLIKAWFNGKLVVIVGQERSGKTTFLDYLQYGFFTDERETLKTDEVSPSARFDVRLGRNAELELSIQSVIDLPGQAGATNHANLVYGRRPHAVIIVTDLTTPLYGKQDRASAAWLSEFCRRLESLWRANKGRGNRIKSVIVMMNKQDRATGHTLAARKKAFRKILDAELREARGNMLEDIPIIPTVLVTNPVGTTSTDLVISHLAKALTK